MLTTKTEILFDVYKKKSEGLFDFLATTFTYSTFFLEDLYIYFRTTAYLT